jgi:hypothetical protein
MKKIFFAFLLLLAVACTKKTIEEEEEKTYLYDVNTTDVNQHTGVKGTAKSTTEFISIAYSDLFGTTIANDALAKLFTAYSSFGDKKLIEDRIIRNFLDLPGANVPTDQQMRNDIPVFLTNSYKKFFNRNPNEFEKYYLKSMIENDTTITPEMMYYSFMTSNEYRYY